VLDSLRLRIGRKFICRSHRVPILPFHGRHPNRNLRGPDKELMANARAASVLRGRRLLVVCSLAGMRHVLTRTADIYHGIRIPREEEQRKKGSEQAGTKKAHGAAAPLAGLLTMSMALPRNGIELPVLLWPGVKRIECSRGKEGPFFV
jgi:hypothetical protein